MDSGKVLIAMSGGIDSSVAAMLMIDKGYRLVGATFKVFDQPVPDGESVADPIAEARRMAEGMGFEHHAVDLREVFRNEVIADFINEYLNGRTPNPCVVCNATIKWGRMLQVADDLGCSHIATGHYARIGRTGEGRYYLRVGADPVKDQTYFLWRLTQENLARTIFPLGDLTKEEVRRIAFDNGHEQLSKKGESQEICFIPDNDYRRFLRVNVKDYALRYAAGNYIDSNGRVLGRHCGFPSYTIGQRKGLGVAFGEPRYVVRIDAQRNEVVIGSREELYTSVAYASDVNMMMLEDFADGAEVYAKVRYQSKSVPARLFHDERDGRKVARIEFDSPIESITPGQSVVFYVGEEHDCVLGGGILIR